MRRGPGWWMDLDGKWRPPEEWPENTPPLPGWVIGEDGTWSAPDLPEPTVPSTDPPAPEIVVVTPEATPIPVARPRTPTTPTPPDDEADTYALTFAAPSATLPDPEVRARQRTGRMALWAAVLSAITAAMIAAGLVFLLTLV